MWKQQEMEHMNLKVAGNNTICSHMLLSYTKK